MLWAASRGTSPWHLFPEEMKLTGGLEGAGSEPGADRRAGRSEGIRGRSNSMWTGASLSGCRANRVSCSYEPVPPGPSPGESPKASWPQGNSGMKRREPGLYNLPPHPSPPVGFPQSFPSHSHTRESEGQPSTLLRLEIQSW